MQPLNNNDCVGMVKFNFFQSVLRRFITCKIIIYCAFLHQVTMPSSLIVVNNSLKTVLIGDSVDFAVILAPSEQYIVRQDGLAQLFLYELESATSAQKFKLICVLYELHSGSKPVTIYWSDIVSRLIYAQYPNRFEVTHQARLNALQRYAPQTNSKKLKDQGSATPSYARPGCESYHQASKDISSEQPQDLVDSLISQFSLLQEKQKTIDTKDFKPQRTPPHTPKTTRKK